MFILLGFDVKTENWSKSYFDFRTTYETGLKFSTYLGSYNIIRFTIDLQKRVEVYLLFQIGFKKRRLCNYIRNYNDSNVVI